MLEQAIAFDILVMLAVAVACLRWSLRDARRGHPRLEAGRDARHGHVAPDAPAM
jgi:hypothetical protein